MDTVDPLGLALRLDHQVLVFQGSGGRYRGRMASELNPTVRHRGISVASVEEARRMFGPDVMLDESVSRASLHAMDHVALPPTA